MIWRVLVVLALSLIGTAVTANEAHRCSQVIPEGPTWAFARAIVLDENFQDGDRAQRLSRSCQTINPAHEGWFRINNFGSSNIFARGYNEIVVPVIDSFRVLRGSEVRDQYMAELNEIRNAGIPSARERIKRVYELFLRYQKDYNPERIGGQDSGQWIFSPGETLEEGGVCRDFARLLRYSLDQVRTIPSTSSGERAEMFTTNFEMAANADETSGHAWVNVRVPRVSESGRIEGWEDFSLDPTNFTESYTPLMPLAQNLPRERLSEYYNICGSIVSCLNENSADRSEPAIEVVPGEVVR